MVTVTSRVSAVTASICGGSSDHGPKIPALFGQIEKRRRGLDPSVVNEQVLRASMPLPDCVVESLNVGLLAHIEIRRKDGMSSALQAFYVRLCGRGRGTIAESDRITRF